MYGKVSRNEHREAGTSKKNDPGHISRTQLHPIVTACPWRLQYTQLPGISFESTVKHTAFVLLKQHPGYTTAHQAGDGSPDQCFYTQFCKIFTLVRRQLADAPDLYAYRSKIGKTAKRVSGYKQGFGIGDKVVLLHFS